MSKKVLRLFAGFILGFIVGSIIFQGFTLVKIHKNREIYMVLVNKQNKLPDNWEDKIKLVAVKNQIPGDDREFLVEEKALKQFYKLRDELLEEGINIELDSTYRSVKEQQELWDEWAADPELGEEYCKKYLSPPGYSEHHTGLAIDVCLVKNGRPIYENEDMIAEREIFAKVHSKLAKYGFILRYPEGKENVTGYNYEPWHFRYIGERSVAEKITKEGLTFEEYLSNK